MSKRSWGVRCPYCNKPAHGLGLLNAHMRKDHPEHFKVIQGIRDRLNARQEAR